MPLRRKLSDLERRRRQDIVILSAGAVILVTVLSLTGALGWLEGISAAILLAGGGLAYHAGVLATTRVTQPVGKTSSSKSGKKATRRARQSLIDALNQPALIIDGAGQLVAYNEDAAHIFSLPAVRPGLSASSLRHPELLAHVDRVLTDGGQATCEIARSREPDQTWLVTITALDEHKVGARAALVVMTDQAPVRRAERARADFLANASHELRTPLTSVSGFLETMQGPARDDPASWPRFIQIMADQTSHMKHLITDLLSLSRIELSEHQAPTTRIELVGTARDMLEALNQLAGSKNQTILFDAREDEIAVIAAEGEMRQVIQNLVGNALKFAPDGSEIEVTMGRSRDLDAAEAFASRNWTGAGRATLLSPSATLDKGNGGVAWLRVRDHGPGIARDYLPRLGERFYRVDSSRGGPVEGTGLGLAIVKHIMAHHRGGMAVESVEGEGTAFSVWLPAINTRSP